MAKSVTTSTAKRAASKKAPAVITEIPGGLPSATATAPQHAEPEPKPVEGGAASSSTEASIAAAQATGTGEAVGQVVTGDLPATDATNQATGAEAARKRVSEAFDEFGTRTIRITSRIEGFRRAGMRHSKTPTDHSFYAFTAEQLDQLDDEPNLKVEYL
ncbi:HI1506-related protein [Pleomorphomonas koreensis]|uniref:HI1506-related protein n=1 Tax=Pleomorphomonas koreensis TaxID=257440 RepID=UPI00047D4084|nr:HI1506-related protein [Pleomorphomonas koreensis]